MKLQQLTPKQLKSVERTLSAGTWTITSGAILFSVLTVTPLVERVTPDGWGWTAPILPIVVDAAVVIVIRLDATVSRLGESGGGWPTFLRWLTGVMTLALNVGDSALKGDLVGVAVHAVAPLLLIVTAEASLGYRQAISRALDRIAREQQEEREQAARERREREGRERRERQEREHRERADREQERAAREQQERAAREHQLRLEREQRDAAREQREWEAEQERQREERQRQDRREREERERRDRLEREAEQERKAEATRLAKEADDERIRQEQARLEEAKTARREQQRAEKAERVGVRGQSSRASANTPAKQPANSSGQPSANTPKDKMEEDQAEAAIVAGVAEGAGVRELHRRTGWSLAWVSERVRDARAEQSGERQEPVLAGADR